MLMSPKTMSESVDSFENLEFEQSALAASPTSDQESADLTTSDQQSTVLITSDHQSSGNSSATGDQQSADLTTIDQQSTGLITSDQHSNGLTTGDQHSSSKSSAATMSSSTAKTGQSEDLEFELPWMIRKEIADILNQLTALLSGLVFTADVREIMRKANSDLVTALMNLPVKGGGRPKSFESPESRPDNGLNEVVLCLSEDVKSRIIDTLVANQHVALLGADFVSSERKLKLIDQNTDLAYELLKLRPRAIPGDSSKDDRLIDPTAKTSESHTTSTANEKELGELDSPESRPAADEVAILKEELEQRMDSMISNVQENVRALKEELATSKDELATLKGEVVVSGSEVTVMKGQVEKLEIQNTVLLTDLEQSERRLKEQMATSKGEVEKLRVRVGGVDVCRSEITITSELKGIEALLAPGAKRRNSKAFTCGGISWYLNVYPCVKDAMNYLSVFLNRSIDPDRWSVVATYEVRLLSSDAGSDVVRTIKHYVFKNPDKFTGYGWDKFITVGQLRSGSFIKDDTIKFRIHLTTKNLERNADFE